MKLENILKPIRSESIEGHEKELQDKMIAIELQYVDNLFFKKIPPLNEDLKVDNIKDLVSKYTEIPSRIMEYRHGRFSEKEEKELLTLKEKILNDISILYHKDHEHWIEKTEELVNNELEKYKNLEKKENQDDNSDLKNKAGLIGFGMETNLGHLLPGMGLSDEDLCLGIHFDDFYKQQKEDVKNLFSSNSLEKLAVKIIEEHPEAKAVVGRSWLMDTPIAKRIGFTVYHRDLEFNSGPFWGQFIDSNGQIKNNEVSKFLKTGEPKFKIAIGAIKVEDFLRKYLPEDRKGKIILKEQTAESKKFIEDLNRISEELKKWDELSLSELVSILNSTPVFAEYFKTPNGQECMKMYKRAKELNLKKDTMFDFNYENKDQIKENVQKFLEENKNKFTEREVII